MTYPTYIKLTLTKVTTPAPGNRPGMMHQTHLQPPIVKMFPLPLAIGKQQTGEPFAEVDLAPGVTGTCSEHFDDVAQAIEDASSRGDIVVKPIQREAIAAAVAGSLRAVGKGSPEDEAAVIAGHRWNDVGMGEALPEPKTGDLRIVQTGDNWQVEYRVVDEDGNHEWTRGPALSGELRATYETLDVAIEAVRVAGYARRLVELP